MPAFQTTRLAVAVIIVLTATSCGPTFYYVFSQTRTYEYERRLPIVVRSDPAGATIMTSDGTVLGEAPMIVDAKVRVRRSHRFHNTKLATRGCIIDVVASSIFFGYSFEVFGGPYSYKSIDDLSEHSSGEAALKSTGLRLAGAGLAVSCGGIFLMSYKLSGGPAYTDTDERIIPSTLNLTARWDGLGDVHAQLDLLATRTFTLRLPRMYTFEEALILWARETAPPPTAENFYRVGDTYRILALRGVHGAMEHAVGLFIRYLQLYPATGHADNVRRALEELRSPGRRER
jgi:hypothetical protein